MTIYLFLLTLATFGNGLLISDVTLVTPEGAQPHMDVQITADTISQIGPHGTIAAEDCQTLDGTGRYLIPGLVDTHVHLDSIPGMSYPQSQKHPDLVKAYKQQLPRSYLYHGFTTLIDLNVVARGSIDAFKRAPLHPDVYDCDCALPIINGYPMHYLPVPFRYLAYRNFLVDPDHLENLPPIVQPEQHTPAAAIARVKQAKGICVKSFYEPGFDGDQLPLPQLELMKEVRAQSRAAGLTLALHANGLQGHRFADQVGVDVIVHGLWNWDRPYAEGELPTDIQAVLDTHIAQQIGFSPTARVIAGLGELFDPSFLDNPQLADVLPAALLAWYKSEEGQWFTRAQSEAFGNLPAAQIAARYRQIEEQGDRVTRYLIQHGGRLVFGSDTPSSPIYTNPPGYNGTLELERLAANGLPLPRLLALLTRESAQAYDLDGQVGSVAVGKRANLLLLERDPLQSVEAYRAIATVIIGGTPIPRAELSAKQLTGTAPKE